MSKGQRKINGKCVAQKIRKKFALIYKKHMESGSHKTSKRKLRRSIKAVIGNIETVMTGIHDLLGEMGLLVQQIDRTAERIENKFRNKLKEKELVSDSNQSKSQKPNTLPLKSSKRTSPCLVMDYTHSKESIHSPFGETSNSKQTLASPFMDYTSNSKQTLSSPFMDFTSNSKQTLPSPFMDYTYLELVNSCEICDKHVGKFTYNEKYPLWIQYDTWRTGNTTSDISLVSGGSDVKDTTSESNNNSWKSAGNVADSLKNKTTRNFRQLVQNEEGLKRFDTCCNGEVFTDDQYCGVYELIMEDLLEFECLSLSSTRQKHKESFNNSEAGDSSSNISLSLSDEHVFRYNNVRNTWATYYTENAFIEPSCSTCS